MMKMSIAGTKIQVSVTKGGRKKIKSFMAGGVMSFLHRVFFKMYMFFKFQNHRVFNTHPIPDLTQILQTN